MVFCMNWILYEGWVMLMCWGLGCLWPSSLFSRALIWMSLRVFVLFEKVTNTPTEQTMHYLLFSCSVETLLPFFACLCEMKAINMLSGCCCLKDGYFSLLLLWVLWVCFKKTFFFSLHWFRQYTNIWVLGYVFVCLICGCFLLLHTTTASSSSSFSIIMKKIFFVTLLLFLAAFSIASRKIQKGKVQRNVSFAYMSVWVCVC